MKKFNNQSYGSHVDRMNYGGAKFCRFALLPLMLLMLLLVPTRMVAQTTTEDPRYALFKNLEGITDVTITDDGGYPWQMLDLNADGMKDLGFTIPDGSKGLMSSNYHVDGSSSETVVNFTVEKPMLLMFKYLVSSEEFDEATITLDNKKSWTISEINQIEIKKLLSVGKHSLKLSYKKDDSVNDNADRTCIYDLKTATTFSEYVADYVATNSTLTFKKITSDNLEGLDLSRMAVVDNIDIVQNVCTNYSSIKNIVFDESFKTYAPTSLSGFFIGCESLETISGLEYLNTANVEIMDNMFHGCSALTSLDLTNFNTAKVTYMNNMFEGCSALTTIYASDKFDTDNVRNSIDMFTGCKSLKDYSDSKTDHTYANYGTIGYFTPVFDYAEFDNATGTLTFRRSLSKPAGAYDLNVESNDPGWNAQSANIKKVVFDASFANARPTSCCRWFADCFYLTEIEGIENLNTQNVTDMSWMFTCCYALTSLDVSNFNTQNVEDMTDMFLGCEGLSLLDLSNFNTERVENMSSMFSGCSTLQTIFASDKFVTDQVSGGYDMFLDCTNLKGFIDYISDSDKNGNEYANYKTGYFTKLVGKNGEKKIGATGDALTTENLVLDDGKDFVAYEPFAAKAASYNRTINPGTTWATLCLPFEVSLENQNFRAFKLLSADDVAETVELEEIETSIAAGTPVIIKMKDGAKSLSISEADKAIAKDVQASETANGNYQLQGIYTQKVFDKVADNNCYIVKGNKLMNPAKLLENSSTTQVGSKPFRAYMVDKSSAPAAGARMFSIAIGGGTTAIDSLKTIADDKAVYYDLQGNRLNAPQKGINIVKRNGKTMKVIIK